jgi:hypothetical protein
VVYTLLDALVSLYPARADESADTEHPVWKEVCAEGLRLTPKPVVVETRPTGAAAPKRHPLVVTHEISLARVWAPELVAANPLGQADPQPDTGRYVLDVVWHDNEQTEAGLRMWHRQTYYGVTLESRERGDRERLESTENYVFAAERMETASGQGVVPGL